MNEFYCPGCNVPLTNFNVGGYRSYCMKCVNAFPVWPEGVLAANIEGSYPTFKWVPETTSQPNASHQKA